MKKKLFPVLESKIAERRITKKSIAQGMGIDAVTFSRKLAGKVEFTLKEIRYMHVLFPEVSVEVLFGMKESKGKPEIVPFTFDIDDTKLMESLEKIEERLDRLAEKADRLGSILEKTALELSGADEEGGEGDV